MGRPSAGASAKVACGWRGALGAAVGPRRHSACRGRFQGASSSSLWSFGSAEVRTHDFSLLHLFCPLYAACLVAGVCVGGALLPRTMLSPEPACTPQTQQGSGPVSLLCARGSQFRAQGPLAATSQMPACEIHCSQSRIAGRFGQGSTQPHGPSAGDPCPPGTAPTRLVMWTVVLSTGPLWPPPLEPGEATRGVSLSLLHGHRYSELHSAWAPTAL